MAKFETLCIAIALALCASACAPSPLYNSKSASIAGTPGTIPRDGNGEPIWSQIPAAAETAEPAAGAPKPMKS
jgi:hypothetical protein